MIMKKKDKPESPDPDPNNIKDIGVWSSLTFAIALFYLATALRHPSKSLLALMT